VRVRLVGFETWGRCGVCMLRGSAGYRNAGRNTAAVSCLRWWASRERFLVEALGVTWGVARGVVLA
jgi:hypothetical protein